MTRKAAALIISALFFLIASLACGMTAPVPLSDGRLGSEVSTIATVIDTPKVTFGETESLFIVTVDVLNIRPCPQDSDQCPPLGLYLFKDDIVMGGCLHFANGDIWLAWDHRKGEPTKYAAVRLGGEVFMKGNCNG